MTPRFIDPRPMNKSSAIIAAMALAVTAAGCAYEPTCDYSKEPYVEATSVPSLTAPEGLTPPDRTASLKVPPPPPDAKPMPSGKGRCLDRPPSYFATSENKSGDDKKGDMKDK